MAKALPLRAWSLVFTLGSGISLASPVQGQPVAPGQSSQPLADGVSARDRARALGGEALTALDAQQYAAAESLFSQALELFDAPTLRLGRARSAQALGHWLVAVEDYRKVIAAAPGSGETEAFAAARRSAQAELAELLPRVPKLLVSASAVQPQSITVDGAAWTLVPGDAPSIDPGKHQVVATFPSGTVSRTIEVPEGGVLRVEIAEPLASPPPAAPQSVSHAAPTSAGTPPADAKKDAAADSNTALTVAVVGTGVLAVAAVVTAVVAFTKRSNYNQHNTPNESYDTKRDLRTSAKTWAWVNTGITGGAVLGAGVSAFLWLTDDSTAQTVATSATADPGGVAAPSLNGVSFGICGHF